MSRTVRRSVLMRCVALACVLALAMPVGIVAAEPIKAGLATDASGFGDNAYNDLAWAGLERSNTDIGTVIASRESASGDDYVPNLNALAADGCDLVFGVWFLMTEAVAQAAAANPGTTFVGIDQVHDPIPANVADVTFRVGESAYLAGVVAGLATLSDFDPRLNAANRIAFIGGMDIPIVEAFEAGYVAGAKSVNPDVFVDVLYAGDFANEGIGESLGRYAISKGADVIFAAAGGSGRGVATACEDAGALFIGVDTDQYLTWPGIEDTILTSAIQKVDNAVYDIVDRVTGGESIGGQMLSYGLAEEGVGLAPFHEFDGVVPQSILDAIDDATTDIVTHVVTVPTERTPLDFGLVEDGVLTVGIGDDTFEPFMIWDEGEVYGFDPELVAHIAERLGLDYVFADYPFGDLIDTLEAGGEIDMIASALTITPERAERIDYSDSYYADLEQGELALAFNKASPALREAVNGVLAMMRADGSMDDLLRAWFGQIRVEGDDRYQTAIAASWEAYPYGLDPDGPLTVVIATGRNWPDALGGTSLAGVLDCPILLTNTNSIPAAVLEEVGRLGAEKAIVLGGTAAVGPAVIAALEGALGDDNVERIWGDTRYQTADAVALRVIAALGAEYDGTAFVATGAQFADAVAAAPLAAAKRWPLYLVNPARTSIYTATVAAMADVEDVLVLGGTAAVPAAIATELDGLVPGEVTRLEGSTRYATAVAIATWGVDHAGLGWNRVGIATGEDYPDALAGGVLQGRYGSVMLLTRPTSLRSETREALEASAGEIVSVTFFGGGNAVSEPVREAALIAAGVIK